MKMTRVGVLSDTHIASMSYGGAWLCAVVEKHFQGVATILHAGDIVDPDILLHLAPRNVLAVRGNLDPDLPELPHKRIIEVGDFRIGLVHGWGAPAGIVDRVLGEFADDALDCLVFGHSHQPLCERRGNLLLFNPGSPTDRRASPFHSVGLLEIGAHIRGRIIRIPGPTQGDQHR